MQLITSLNCTLLFLLPSTQADELCRRCLLCVMRGLLGEDDAAILSEAQVSN